MKKNEKGFTAAESMLVLIIVGLIGSVGWYVWQSKDTKTDNAIQAPISNPSASNSETLITDPYSGWKSATSSRAKFSIKYPADWTYTETVDDKDNVETIVLQSSKLRILIHSFNGDAIAPDGKPFTKCLDCQQAISAEAFNAGALGSVNLETITKTLDNGVTNALILRQNDGTYYITSPTAPHIKTNFDATTKFELPEDYHAETPAQFAANSDFATAKLILKSVSY